jgi:hypothetical protein
LQPALQNPSLQLSSSAQPCGAAAGLACASPSALPRTGRQLTLTLDPPRPDLRISSPVPALRRCFRIGLRLLIRPASNRSLTFVSSRFIRPEPATSRRPLLLSCRPASGLSSNLSACASSLALRYHLWQGLATFPQASPSCWASAQARALRLRPTLQPPSVRHLPLGSRLASPASPPASIWPAFACVRAYAPSPVADPLAAAFELAINPRPAPRVSFQPSRIGLRQSCGNRPSRWPPSVRLAPRVRCQLSSRKPSALYLRLAPSIHLRTRRQLALSSSPPAPPPGSASACPPAVSSCLNRSRRACAPRPIPGSPAGSPSSLRSWGTRPAAVVVSFRTRAHLLTLRPRREPGLPASVVWLSPLGWELSAYACCPC